MPYGRVTLAGQVRLTSRLARRLARSRALARSVAIVFVAALLVMAMFVTLRTLSLSGEQVADNELGRFGAKVGYGSGVSLLPGDDTFLADLRSRVRDAGATDAEIVLSATDVQLNTTPARNVTALETDWTSRPYPERYELLSGRWPSRPGEVAVTEPGDVRTPVGKTLTVLGDVRLKVVATVDDRAADTTNLLLGPGTWAGLDPALSKGFPVLTAQMDVMWAGRAGRRSATRSPPPHAPGRRAVTTVRKPPRSARTGRTPWPRLWSPGTSLIIPEVFSGVLRLLPEGGPRRRLVRRQLAADRSRACAALAVLTVLFGASLMLRTTANALDLPVQTQGPVMVTGVPATEARALQQAVVNAGMDAPCWAW